MADPTRYGYDGSIFQGDDARQTYGGHSVWGDIGEWLFGQANSNSSAGQERAAAQKAYEQNLYLQHDAQNFNSAEAQKQRDYESMMSNTAHQREVADLQAAGLNPILSAMNGSGASTPSGAAATSSTSSAQKANGPGRGRSGDTFAKVFSTIVNASSASKQNSARLDSNEKINNARISSDTKLKESKAAENIARVAYLAKIIASMA